MPRTMNDGAPGRATTVEAPRWFRREAARRRPPAVVHPTAQRILLAEDDHEMRRFLVSALRRDGYDVVPARSGSELLEALGDHLLHAAERPPIDLVISDVRMPDVTGLTILRWLRNEDWVTPFIVMTAFGSETVRREAIAVGANAFVDKPFEMHDLRELIRGLIGVASK